MNTFDRFWSKVEVGLATACWNWLEGTNSAGYGAFRISRNRVVNAHRAAFELTYANRAQGFDIMHTCHNKLCVNPRHLKMGTRAENILHTGYTNGTIRRNNYSGLTGVSLRGRSRWEAYTFEGGGKASLYTGKDFFEACCARKSWEARARARQ